MSDSKKFMFKRLVDNAIDFLSKAIEDLEEHPKYSMINFQASVELFLKARLMEEHWTLVIAKRQEPDWAKFVVGDFQSVSLNDAAIRLKGIVKSGLSDEELKIFREVAMHRNKTVHFFHEAHSENETSENRQEIVKNQLCAWHYLHRLITEQWQETFKPWSKIIAEIDHALRKLHKYLAAIYENLSEDIARKKKDMGIIFDNCPSCGYEAQQHKDEKGVIYESECLVCGLTERSLQIECPDCNTTVFFKNDGFSSCSGCRKNYEPKNVADIIIDDRAAHVAAREGDDSWDLGNCSYCDGYHTVVRMENEGYLCASCFCVFMTMQGCSWCNEPNTGDMEHSYLFGCNYCDGKIAWDEDD